MPRSLRIDLSREAEKAIERMKQEANLTTPDVFRLAMSELYKRLFKGDDKNDPGEHLTIY